MSGQADLVLQMSARQWMLTGYLAVACTVFAFGLQMWAVRRSTPARVALMRLRGEIPPRDAAPLYVEPPAVRGP